MCCGLNDRCRPQSRTFKCSAPSSWLYLGRIRCGLVEEACDWALRAQRLAPFEFFLSASCLWLRAHTLSTQLPAPVAMSATVTLALRGSDGLGNHEP